MSSCNQPPLFKDKPYEKYIKELKEWTASTKLEKGKQAIAVALSFLQNDSAHLRRQVFSELKVDELKEEDGIEKLITLMNRLYKEDLTHGFESYKKFNSFQQSPGEPIHNYITKFEELYKEIKNHSMELPENVLSYKLLDGSLLDLKEKELILSHLENNKKMMFAQLKNALRNFSEKLFSTGNKKYRVNKDHQLQKDEFYENKQQLEKENQKVQRAHQCKNQQQVVQQLEEQQNELQRQLQKYQEAKNKDGHLQRSLVKLEQQQQQQKQQTNEQQQEQKLEQNKEIKQQEELQRIQEEEERKHWLEQDQQQKIREQQQRQKLTLKQTQLKNNGKINQCGQNNLTSSYLNGKQADETNNNQNFQQYNRVGYTYQRNGYQNSNSRLITRNLKNLKKSESPWYINECKDKGNNLPGTFRRDETYDQIEKPHRERTFVIDAYDCGDKVYYKHDLDHKWKGPATVTEKAGKITFVRHGNSIVRVPSSRLIKKDTDLTTNFKMDIKKDLNKKDKNNKIIESEGQLSIVKMGNLPKVGDMIEYRETNFKRWKAGKVISTADKKNELSNCFLVNNPETNETFTLDFHNNVSEWRHQTPTSKTLALQEANILKAKKKELDRWKNYHVYEETDANGQNSISTQWVISTKTPMKARLLIKGFEDEVLIQTELPRISKDTIRIFFALCSSLKWQVESMEVKGGFLKDEISKELLIAPPKEANVPKEKIWRVKKIVYGTHDTSRNWFQTIKKELLSLHCQQSVIDKAMFRWYYNSRLAGMVVLQGDDYFYAGTEQFRRKVIAQICEKFQIQRKRTDCARYSGLNIIQNEESIQLEQKADDVSEVPVSITRMMHKHDDLRYKEKKQLRILIDRLNIIANQSRPDLCFDLLKANMKFKNAKVEDLLFINKVVKKLKSNKSTLLFPNLGNLENLRLVLFNDAGYANLPDKLSSTGGRIVFLTGKNDRTCPVSWDSSKVKCMAKCPIEAESSSLVEGLEKTKNIGKLLTEILYNTIQINKIPIVALVDNRTLEQNLYSNVAPIYEGIETVQQMINKRDAGLKWITHSDQLAGCLTKNGSMTNKLLDFVKRGVIQGIRT